MTTSTYHGSKERVSWSVTRNDSTMSHGENEESAQADYMKRAKTLHQGESIRLERLVSVEAWIQHHDVIAQRAKDVA